ncbi:MAG TPA: MASE1 domain-containing protein, partial [Thermoanaerobaculia bacterium]|nr:MASE1 domain-containing protein [Thermoanaerobaculia bacterium]
MHATFEPAQPNHPARARSTSIAWITRVAGLAVIYVVTGRISLAFASLHQSASPVWPPSGIALAAVILYGARVWPAIFVGAFLVNVLTIDSALASIGIAAGNTLEALVGGWLVARFARGSEAFETASTVLRFVFFGGLVAPIVSATFGVASLGLGGLVEWERFGPIWLTWWIGNMVGVILVAPILLIWSGARPRDRRDLAMLGETAAAVAVVTLVALLVFGGVLPPPFDRYPSFFICFPPLLWPVFRLGRPGTVAALGALAGVALAGTVAGHGPFAQFDLNTSLLLVQLFTGTIAVMNLVLASLVGERSRASVALRRNERELSSQLHEIEDLYRTAPVGLCLLDQDLRYVRINSCLAEINGLPVSAHLGCTVRDVVPDLADRAETFMREVLATGRPVLDHEIESRDEIRPGVKRSWLESYYPVRGVDGMVDGVSCVVQDITALKEAETLARAERRLELEAQAHSRVEAEVAAAVESERLRLGTELHEGLGQELAGIAYLMAALHRTLRGAASEQAASEAMRLEDMITRSIERTRVLAKAFYPVEMETLGLVGSLEEMAYNAMRSFDVRCRVHADLESGTSDL